MLFYVKVYFLKFLKLKHNDDNKTIHIIQFHDNNAILFIHFEDNIAPFLIALFKL